MLKRTNDLSFNDAAEILETVDMFETRRKYLK